MKVYGPFVLFVTILVGLPTGSPAQSLTQIGEYSTLAENRALDVANTALGEFVIVGSHTENRIQTFVVNAGGPLSPAMTTPLTTAGGPQAAVATPDGSWVVLACQNDSILQVYALEAASGTLSALGDPVSTVGSSPTAMAMSPNGEFVAVANGSGDGLAVFELDQAAGTLSLCDSTALGGFAPRAVDIADNGVVAVGHETGTFEILRMSIVTGELVSLDDSGRSGQSVNSIVLNAAADTVYTGAFHFGPGGASVEKFNLDTDTGATSLEKSVGGLGDPFSTPKLTMSEDENFVLVATVFVSDRDVIAMDKDLNQLTSLSLSGPPAPSEFEITTGQSDRVFVSSTFNGTTTVIQWDKTPVPTPPIRPSGLMAIAISPTQVDLSWTDNADNEDSYSVDRSLDSGETFQELATLPADSTAYSDSTVVASQTYVYRVRAVNAFGETQSNPVSVLTPDDIPVAPSNLTGSAFSPTQVDLSWTDNSNNEDGFTVRRRLPGSDFEDIDSIPVEANNYSDITVDGNTTYEYIVVAFNTVGVSEPSNVIMVTTPVLPRPPDDPTDLVATPEGPNQVDLSWTDVPDNEAEYVIQRRLAGGGLIFTDIMNLPPDSTSYVDTTVEPGTSYHYRVAARNPFGEGQSNIATATTPSGPPAAPTNCFATFGFSAEGDPLIVVFWHDNAMGESGYRVFRSVDGGVIEPITTLGENANRFTDIDVDHAKDHAYYVVSFNSDGDSPPSNTTTVVSGTEYDYGDAPDLGQSPGYPTTLDRDGARHIVLENGPFLRLKLDGDTGNQTDSSATADDVDGNDDEDGVRFDTPLVPGRTAQVTVVASQPAKLDGWIDYNRDGDWSDTGEHVFDTVDLGAGPTPFSFQVPANAGAGVSFARFRVSLSGGLDVTGLADNGEVEDYQVPLGALPPTILLSRTPGMDPVLNLPFSGILECSLKIDSGWTVVPLPGEPGTFVITAGDGQNRYYRFLPSEP